MHFQGGSEGEAYHASYRATLQNQSLIDEGFYESTFRKDVFVDLRAFQFCVWDQNLGCAPTTT